MIGIIIRMMIIIIIIITIIIIIGFGVATKQESKGAACY